MDRTTHAERRARVLERLGGGALVVWAGREQRRNGDAEYGFRQESDFLWLTGFDEPESLLVLNAASDKPFTLFVRPRDREQETWTGRRAGVEGAKADFGADEAFEIEKLEAELPKRLAGASTLHYATGIDPAMDARVVAMLATLRRRTRQGVVPIRIQDPGLVLHELRMVKDAAEIDALRKAAALTAEGFARALRACRPGVHEYELEAELLYAYRKGGGAGPGYQPIVAAGVNATILHYRAGDAVLEDGAVVLIDSGCEFRGYTADVTRTWPVNGTFSPAQEALYRIVLAANEAAIAAVRPGATIPAIHEVATRVLIRGLVAEGLLEGDEETAWKEKTFRRFYMHGTSHWLGMDVHDVGGYFPANAPRPLAPGMVLTIEPGLYVRPDEEKVPEAFRGIGIRIEDDVLVTATGGEVLTAAIPKRIEDLAAARR